MTATAVRVPSPRDALAAACVAFVYLRISDDAEYDEAGVRRQDEDCTVWCELKGMEIAGRYVDNDRGASTLSRKKRPDFDRLLLDVVACANSGKTPYIVSYSSSRLSRNPWDSERIISLAGTHRLAVNYTASMSFDLLTADGREHARTVNARDIGDAERISERVRRQTVQRAAKGGENGGPRPFGWPCRCPAPRAAIPAGDYGTPAKAAHVHVPLEQIERERKVVAELTRRVITLGSEKAEVRRFARELNEAGVPTVSGNPWHATTVRDILLRCRNAGIRQHHGEPLVADDGTYVRGLWDAIVTVDEWETCRAILTSPSRGGYSGNVAKHLSSGIITCHCGGRVRGGARGTYVGAECYHLKRKREPIDATITAYVVALLTRDGIGGYTPGAQATDYAGQIERTQIRIAELEDAIVGDPTEDLKDISVVGLKRNLARCQAQLSELQRQRTVHRAPSVLEGVTAAGFAGLPLERQRAIVKELIEVTLMPTNGAQRFDPRQVRIVPRVVEKPKSEGEQE